MAEDKKQSRPAGGPGGRARPVEKPKDLKAILKKLMKYISSEKKVMFLLLFIIVSITGLYLLAPILQSSIVNNIGIEQ